MLTQFTSCLKSCLLYCVMLRLFSLTVQMLKLGQQAWPSQNVTNPIL